MDTQKQSSFVYGLVGMLVAVIMFAGGYYLCASQKAAPVENSSRSQGEAKASTDVPKGVVFYYGQECPHCHDVLAFFKENDIASKVEFEQKETWHDEKNGEELIARAKVCGYAPNQIGVPFLYADGECYVGTPDVIGYFSERAGISAAESDEPDGE